MDAACTHRLLDRPAGVRARRARGSAADAWDGAGAGRLCCAACGRPVTSPAWVLSVAGAHEHRFVNPHGFLFHVGCFARAPGCAPEGEEHAEYTWFPGWHWRIARCAACGAHLGWAFAGRDPRFHGLILDRLRAGEEPAA